MFHIKKKKKKKKERKKKSLKKKKRERKRFQGLNLSSPSLWFSDFEPVICFTPSSLISQMETVFIPTP